MRVLHFYKTAFPDTVGGVEQLIHQLALGVARRGWSVDVLALTEGGSTSTMAMDCYQLHRVKQTFSVASMGVSLAALSKFKALAQHADIVHYHFPWPFMDLLHFTSRVKKPTVVTYHSDIIRQKKLLKIYRPLKTRFLGDVDCIVATSPNYLETSDVLAQYKDRVRIIPIGLDKTTYPIPTAGQLTDWREKLGPKFFLFVGVLRYYKGLHILLEAARGSTYPIVIVGAGPIEQELREQAKALGLNNVHFVGQVSEEDKVALLMLCYGVLFPSHLRSEAFGISLLEGAMYGKPMISSEIGTGTTYINISQETGLVVPPSDPAALRQAMTYLWENPGEAAEMGQRAEARYWQHFTADQMINSYVNLYEDLLRKPSV